MINPNEENNVLTLYTAIKTLTLGRVVFYGAGSHCRELVGLLLRCRMPFPDAIMDDNPDTSEIVGIPVVTPSGVKLTAADSVILAIDDPRLVVKMKNNLIKQKTRARYFEFKFDFSALKKSYQFMCDQEMNWHTQVFVGPAGAPEPAREPPRPEAFSPIYPRHELTLLKKYGVNLLDTRKKLNFLEIGTGLFPVLTHAGTFKTIRVTALDVIADRYKEFLDAKKITLPVKWIQGKAEHLPQLIKGSRFDLIMMDNSLDHTINPSCVVRHCANALKHNGVLLIKSHCREGTRAHWRDFHNHDLAIEDNDLVHFDFFQQKTYLNKDIRLLKHLYHEFYHAKDQVMGQILCFTVAFRRI